MRHQGFLPFIGLVVLASIVAMLAGVGDVRTQDDRAADHDLIDAPAVPDLPRSNR